jgi:hypothetical protein
MISHIILGLSVGTVLQQELSHWNVAHSGSLMEGRSPTLTRKHIMTIRCYGFGDRLAYLQYYLHTSTQLQRISIMEIFSHIADSIS